MLEADVTVLGGGPAGSAFAIALRKLAPDLSVIMLEAEDYRQERIGETLPPGVASLLDYLGAWPAFQAQGHEEAYLTRSAWGQSQVRHNDFMLYGAGNGWILNRNSFDAMLADLCVENGVSLLKQARFLRQRCQRHGRVELALVKGDGSPFVIKSRFVVDAMGRKAGYARCQGARPLRFDRLIGVCGFFEQANGSRQQGAQIEAFPQGWWYSAPLSGKRLIVACMTDVDLMKRLGVKEKDKWLSLLKQTHQIGSAVRGGCIEGDLIIKPAASQCLDKLHGEHWLAVGDAASSFDPLSSQGVAKALHGGIQAAHGVAEWITEGSYRGIERYGSMIRKEFEDYLETKALYYREEGRWQDQSFWKRRREDIDLSPLSLVVLGGSACNKKPPDFLSQPAFEIIREICSVPQPAHEVVKQFQEKAGQFCSDHRAILLIQRLLQDNFLQAVQH